MTIEIPTIERPLPVIDEDSRPFWEATARHELRIQRCRDCGQHVFFPRLVCNHCYRMSLEWVEVTGTGTVHSFTIVRRAPHPAFEAKVPYVVALVDLAEGPRLLTTVETSDVDDVRIGQPVRVRFEDIAEGITLPTFEPVPAQDGPTPNE
ncbi:Zn-ribbon domain-containing OB-fold protein [Rhodococcoides yunnanense]|uniref:Zn-ribbon domain-containing OB-fold protein n=1 Tax=Rhodococcoides yunnanense TaxID=278209 RepID=UPI0009354B3F|nr:Zn-ribbon domain-containing OB-fold protein [Rhodococcus yunnanensis]